MINISVLFIPMSKYIICYQYYSGYQQYYLVYKNGFNAFLRGLLGNVFMNLRIS